MKYFGGVLVVILFLSYILFGNHSSGSTHIVTISDNKFEPNRLEILQGDTVRFVNTGSKDVWPASNIHPLHSVYPDSDIRKCFSFERSLIFDACHPIPPGGIYSFTFHEAGDWKYHDHIGVFSASIFVSEKEDYSKPFLFKVKELLLEKAEDVYTSSRISNISILNKEKNFPVSTKTWGTKEITEDDLITDVDYDSLPILHLAPDELEIKRIITQLGIERAIEKIVEETEGGTALSCHAEAHYIGRASYDLLGEKAFGSCDESCHSGCYHGAMEHLIRDEGTSNLKEIFEELCYSFDTEFQTYQCFHGVGHGFTVYLDYDLPEALKFCTQYENKVYRDGCYNGVFMENLVTGLGSGVDAGSHTTSWINWDKPHFPCDSISANPEIVTQCYEMQPALMLSLFNLKHGEVVNECMQAPKEFRNTCFVSYGRNIAGSVLRDHQKMFDACELVPAEYRNACLLGTIDLAVDFWGSTLTNQASEYCAFLKETDRTMCYEHIMEQLPKIFVSQEEMEMVCNTMEEPFDLQCLESL